ncbi:MAG: hypothetical protein BWY87_00446 [Deltaproteobacteria bacterium ADurb.Bin510]|nr:MAG: hypothetical protein BWY87_00446 [Deltaproteobacteria bacterium ADurb.Bin510]
MKKMRVFELAKELTVDPKDLMRVTKDLAIAVETTMSLLDEHDVERIRKRFEKGVGEPEPEQPPQAPSEETVDQRVSAGRAQADHCEIDTLLGSKNIVEHDVPAFTKRMQCCCHQAVLPS